MYFKASTKTVLIISPMVYTDLLIKKLTQVSSDLPNNITYDLSITYSNNSQIY